MTVSAVIIADSISPYGKRLATIEARIHRIVLAELNTHRDFSRNSASSRAIPFPRQLDRFQNDYAYPVSWPAEQPGMQGGAELEGEDLQDAIDLWDDLNHTVAAVLEGYVQAHPDPAHRLHKSLLNRPIEFGQWHTVVISATEWNNFFKLRCHPAAQPEIRAAAEEIKAVYNRSIPRTLDHGEWHLPYVTEDEKASLPLDICIKVSASRCARVSYEKQNDDEPGEKTLSRAEMLADAGHWSPWEHPATPTVSRPTSNFKGWTQARHLMESGQGLPKS